MAENKVTLSNTWRNISRKEIFFLVFLFFLSVTVRTLFINHSLFFGFEQGRDAQIIQDIYQHHAFKLVGPKTDLAGIFHGALYYYLLLIPSFLTGGNPLALSFSLILMSSVLPVILYFFGRSVFHSSLWAGLLAILAAGSYEYIIYARWLSNVTLAIPLIALTYYFLWLFRAQKKSVFFLASCVSAAAAAQFEVVLVLFLGFIFSVFILTRQIPFPRFKTLLLSLIVVSVFFLPYVIFNFRNQNIILHSVATFTHSSSSSGVNISEAASGFLKNMAMSFHKTLSLPESSLVGVLFAALCIGLFFSKEKKKIVFFLTWFFMSLPVIFFSGTTGLYQLYLGVGLSILFLCILSCRALAQSILGRSFLVLFALVIFAGWIGNMSHLRRNSDVFFITIQEGLNYQDQQRVLAYINQDAHGKIFRFSAFTIPYFHPEGWMYLQKYFYPKSITDDGSKNLYIAKEKQVETYWENKWISDFGRTTLLQKNTFGLLEAQKRVIE